MKKYTLVTLSVLVIILLSLLVYRSFKKEDPPSIVTETIYSSKPFILPEPLKFVSNPKLIILYDKVKTTDSIPISKIELVHDTIRLYNNDSIYNTLSKYYLSFFPKNPKLISLDLNSESLSMTTLNIDGSLKTEIHDLDLVKYKYRYLNNSFYSDFNKRKLFNKQRLTYDLTYTFRPIHGFHDLNISVNFNTSKLIYKAGISSSFYHNKLYNDLLIGCTYNF